MNDERPAEHNDAQRIPLLILRLAIAQLEFAQGDGDESVSLLAESVTTLHEKIGKISQQIRDLPENDEAEMVRGPLIDSCQGAITELQQGLVALQFYDKFVQRLQHAGRSLSLLMDTYQDVFADPAKWRHLMETVRNQCTMEEQRILADAIAEGANIYDAIARARQAGGDPGDTGEIELF